MSTFLFCCATVSISICVCVNSQIVWAVEEAGAGLGATSRRSERLLIQHSSSSDLHMVTASLRLHLCVYQMRSATAGFINSVSYISLHTGVWAVWCNDLRFGLKTGEPAGCFRMFSVKAAKWVKEERLKKADREEICTCCRKCGKGRIDDIWSGLHVNDTPALVFVSSLVSAPLASSLLKRQDSLKRAWIQNSSDDKRAHSLAEVT